MSKKLILDEGRDKEAANIEAKIPVILFEEGNKIIAYSPALDLSTCGDTERHARKRFAEAAKIFLQELTAMGTLEEVLEEYGWKKTSKKNKWIPPVFKSCIEEEIKIHAGV